MSIIQMMGGGGGGLQLSANNVSGADTGFIHCGYPGGTNTPNLQVSGGSGNYSFAWAIEGAAAEYGPWVCSNPAAQNPFWSPQEEVCDTVGSSTEVWGVTVIDQSSGQKGELSINVTITWVDQR